MSTVTSQPSGPQSTNGSHPGGEQTLGELVQAATTQVSTLLHNEIELAKTEIRTSATKGGAGIAMFVVAAALALYGLTFGLIALAEGLITLGIWRWAAFLIVFGLLLIVSAILVFVGNRYIKRVRAPERTIAEAKETAEFFRNPAAWPNSEPVEAARQ